MRFRQLDRITQLLPGNSITAERTLSDREGYFRDHFPNFPVMPGALRLEAMFQACNWLVRQSDEFANSVVLLHEVINCKFHGFVCPGQTMTISATVKKRDGHLTTLAAQAEVEGATVASARLVLERFNLAERYPARAVTDPYMRQQMRAEFARLDANSPANEPVTPSSFRWMWIDRMQEFVAGQQAVAIKTVSLTDEPIDLYLPGFPVMPCSLIVEGMAQTGGILVGACEGFRKRIVLAKVSKTFFYRPAVPGDVMVYTANVESLLPEGAVVRATSRIEGQPHAEMELLFAYLPAATIATDLIDPADLLASLRVFGMYDIARNPDGSVLEVPRRMLEAERDAVPGR